MIIVRLNYSEAKHIIGIGKTSGIDNYYKSEDLFYFDCCIWDEELESHAKKRQISLNILTNYQDIEVIENKYPPI